MRKKTKIIIIVVGVIVVGFLGYKYFGPKEPSYNFAEVKRGEVLEEISETGYVKKGEKINLSFKDEGQIEKIYIEKGQEVNLGTPLAKLETSQLKIQLQEQKAVLDLAESELAKLLAGATKEEIALSEAQAEKARTSLKNAEQNLIDVKLTSQENLNQVYQDALNTLDAAFLKIYNAFNVADSIQISYFYYSDQESIEVKESRSKIEKEMQNTKNYLKTAKDGQEAEIDKALSGFKDGLELIYNELKIIRDNCEKSSYKATVSSTDKTSLNNQKSYIIETLSDVVDAQQDIASTKLANQTNINKAEAGVSEAKTSLKEKEKNLAKIKAPPSKEDVDLKEAQLNQAKAKVLLLERKIKDSVLESPLAGEIIKIEKREGEVVSPGQTVFLLLPAKPFQLEVDIYEEDISRVKISNPVKIKLVAFPEKEFKGRVVSIDPAEKIIEEVVYYEVTIDFEEVPENLKPGLTADIVIRTAFKENVLTLSKRVLIEKDGKTFVKVLENKKEIEKEIEIGLKGTNDLVEIISGLKEGEKVILP